MTYAVAGTLTPYIILRTYMTYMYILQAGEII